MTSEQARRLVRCYPRDWRARYSEEFVALLEQQPSSTGVILNVLAGAADAHARHWLRAITAFLALRAIPWLWWIVACASGCVGLVAVLYVALLRYAVATSQAGAPELAARLILSGLFAGTALGTAQWLAVRRAVPRAGRWIVATALGWFLGGALAVALLGITAVAQVQLGWPGDRLLHGAVFGVAVGASMGAGQQRALGRTVPRAGWWAPLCALGWGLGWLVGSLQSDMLLGGSDVGPAFHPAGVFAGVVTAPALSGALAGLLTGPLLMALLHLEAPLRPLARRPHLALPTLAAVLALAAVVAGPAIARSRQPAWRVLTITAWPASVVFPTITPRPATTPRPTGGSFGQTMVAVTTVAAARPHLPFKVLVPATLPPGYRLARVQSTPALLRSPRLSPAAGCIGLVYVNPAQQRSGRDWQRSPDVLPDQPLLITESAADGEQPVDLYAPPGAAHRLSIGWNPAVYIDALAMEVTGSTAVFSDPAIQQLVLVRDGTLVRIIGWRDGGVERTALERLAASLR